VLDVDVRRPAVVGDRAWLVAKHNLLHVRRLDRLAHQQRLQRVERRLNRLPHGPALDVGAGYVIALAQLFDEQLAPGGRRHVLQEILGTRENVVDAGPARLDQQHRGRAALRG